MKNGLLLSIALISQVLLMPTSEAQSPQVAALSQSGKLADGTDYGIVVPPNWNGTLLIDLDFLTSWQTPTYQALFAQGYAGAGTARNYSDPMGGQYIKPWANRQLEAAELTEKRFGKPKRTIAWGNSRGGHVAQAIAQLYPDRITAAIPKCIYGGAATLMNQDLDVMFALKALFAPHDDSLPLVNLPSGEAARTPNVRAAELAAWNDLLTRAQSTAEGRARVALAAAIAQLPDWVDAAVPRPKGDNEDAIADGWLRNVRARIGAQGTFSFMRPAFEMSAGGNFSWNVGVDYKHLLSGKRKKIVEALYRRAGLNLEKDLDAINQMPRIGPDAKAAWFLQEPSVNFNGDMRVPVLMMMTIGDQLLPVTGTWALKESVRRAHHEDMVRMTYTESVGHCNFSVAENLAVVETMRRRLDSGQWDTSTAPQTMNQLADSYKRDGGKFIAYDLEPMERAFFLGSAVPRAAQKSAK